MGLNVLANNGEYEKFDTSTEPMELENNHNRCEIALLRHKIMAGENEPEGLKEHMMENRLCGISGKFYGRYKQFNYILIANILNM